MALVFISCGEEDREMAFQLLPPLDGVEFDFGPETVRPPYDAEEAHEIRLTIERRIARADAVICLLHQESYLDDWVDWEVCTAFDLFKPVVLMGLPHVTGSIILPPAANGHDWHLWDTELLSWKAMFWVAHRSAWDRRHGQLQDG